MHSQLYVNNVWNKKQLITSEHFLSQTFIFHISILTVSFKWKPCENTPVSLSGTKDKKIFFIFYFTLT